MGKSTAKKATRATFVVSPKFGYGNKDLDGAKRLFTDEVEAKKYAEEMVSQGWKQFKSKPPKMPEIVDVEVYDVNGMCTETLSCEPEQEEIVKPTWA